MFGGLKIVKDGKPISPPPYRTYALLSFLLLREKLPIKRERLGGVVYSNLHGDKIRGRMSDHVWLLKKHLPSFPILATAEDISLEKSSIWIDVHAFRESASQTDDPLSEKFIDLYQGELLPEMYDDWIIVERERWRSHYLWALRKLVDTLIKENKFSRATSRAENLLREEPYDEGVVRMLMEIYTKVGRRGAALATYEKFQILNIEEFGLEPEAETKKLYEAIYKQKTLPLHISKPQDETQADPKKIIAYANKNLQQGERKLFQQTLSMLPKNLTRKQSFEINCLRFDEKFLWGELDQAENIIRESKLSSPALQLREARLALAKKEYHQALEILEKVIDNAHRGKQRFLETEALVTLSFTKAELGENQDALLILDRAIFLAEKVGSPTLQVQAYIQKGNFQNLKGTGKDAKEILVKAVGIARQHRLRPLLAQALDVLGLNANYYGNYQSALDYLNESLELARDVGLEALEAKVLLTLSGTFDYLGRFKETTKAIKNATQYYEDKQDLLGLAKCYYNLCYSIVSADEENISDAIKYAEQALHIFSEYENSGWQASTHTALGYLQWLAGAGDQALKNFDSAIKLHTRLEEYRFIPENYAYKGLAYLSKNLPGKAIEFTQMAIRDLTRRSLSDIASEIYYAHASVLHSLGKEEDARLYADLGYELLVDAAGDIEDDHARSGYFHRDPITRRLMEMVYNFGLAPRPKTTVLSHKLPGFGHTQVNLSLTVDAGAADQALQIVKGNTALRRARLKRILKESDIHGNHLPVEEIARLFMVSSRTVQRDMKKIGYN